MRRSITLTIVLLAAASMLQAGEYRTMKPAPPVDDSFVIPSIRSEGAAGTPAFLRSPGTALDSSYYDWQASGSLDRRVWVNEDGSVHATYMKSPDPDFVDRGMIYYYSSEIGGPFFASAVTTYRNGFGNVSSYPISHPMGAIAVLSTHDSGTPPGTFVFVDAFQGLGAFSEQETNRADEVMWPTPAVNSDGSITIVGTLNNELTVNGIAHNVAWDRAPDAGSGFSQTWTWLGEDPAQWSAANMEYPSVISGADGRVAIVIGDFGADVHFYESTDAGMSFTETVITNAAEDTLGLPEEPDSAATVFLPWVNTDIVYVGTEPHIVWTGLQGARQAGSGVVLFDFGSRILHWSPSTGIDTVVVSDAQGSIPSQVDTYVYAGANHASIDWPQIGVSPDGSVLYLVYVAFSPDDIDTDSDIGFGDIYGTYSVDGGETWSEPENLTNPDGQAMGMDDRYPSISPVSYDAAIAPGNDASITYQSDDAAGSWLWTNFGDPEEPVANWDYFMYLAIDFDVSWIEGGDAKEAPLPRAFSLHQNYPNPFNPSTTVRFEVPEGGSAAQLTVYDSRGRKIAVLVDGPVAPGIHQVAWDGRTDRGGEASSGIYFLRLRGGSASKTVKMVLLK